ncbi:MAG: hypothetical protein ABI794_05200 [Betaproteobacteria bacterium]
MNLALQPDFVDITRSMQHMDARNGGLLVDFRPIRRYQEIAPIELRDERVRTVLDWITFAARLGLLTAAGWQRVFARHEDLALFAAESRSCNRSVDPRHAQAFELLQVIGREQATSHASIADAIDPTRSKGVSP